MKGKVYSSSGGGQKTVTITFNTTPTEATVTVRDRDGETVEPISDKTYKLKKGLYYYDVIMPKFYKNIINQEFNALEDETITIKLDIPIYGIQGIGIRKSGTCERIYDSKGLQANSVQGIENYDTTINDFDNIYPWSDIKTCNLDKNGNVLAYIDEPRI